MIFAAIIVGLIGILFVIMGYLIWFKEKISLFHDYHYDRVTEEDKKAFCTISGIGVLIIGISLLITAAILMATDSPASFIAFAVGFVIGIMMLIYAGAKYN